MQECDCNDPNVDHTHDYCRESECACEHTVVICDGGWTPECIFTGTDGTVEVVQDEGCPPANEKDGSYERICVEGADGADPKPKPTTTDAMRVCKAACPGGYSTGFEQPRLELDNPAGSYICQWCVEYHCDNRV